jgi:hypothetical protein
MAGEWIIGGIEAKGFAYVFVLLALGELIGNRWPKALVLLGAATAFHVIIGGWSLLASAVVWLRSNDRPSIAQLIPPLAAAVLIALPGLLPALALTTQAEPRVIRDANRIYVFQRLDHHLSPQSFVPSYAGTESVSLAQAAALALASPLFRHLLLVSVLVVLVNIAPFDGRLQKLLAFVATCVAISAIGMVIGLAAPLNFDFAAALLRFYWFRMSDVMVPLGVALLGVALVARWSTRRSWQGNLAVGALVLLVAAHFGCMSWWRQRHMYPPADATIANLDAWRQMCQWAAAETPADAVFLTPRTAQTFRWYAGRAEVVSRKDIPQDAAGIVQWWQRMNRIYRAEPGNSGPWQENLAALGSARLRELGAEFGADYAITAAYPPLNLPRVGPSNPSIAIYRLTASAAASRGPPSPEREAP